MDDLLLHIKDLISNMGEYVIGQVVLPLTLVLKAVNVKDCSCLTRCNCRFFRHSTENS